MDVELRVFFGGSAANKLRPSSVIPSAAASPNLFSTLSCRSDSLVVRLAMSNSRAGSVRLAQPSDSHSFRHSTLAIHSVRGSANSSQQYSQQQPSCNGDGISPGCSASCWESHCFYSSWRMWLLRLRSLLTLQLYAQQQVHQSQRHPWHKS
jgi:hypothetical protein